jgi:allene oxide cyclase-like protein
MHKLGIAIVAALFLTIAGVAAASHSSGPLTIAGKTVQLNLVDVGEPGFTLGDQVALSDDLRVKGKPAGIDGGVCTLIRIADAKAQSGTAQCQITYSLDGGQVTAQGLFALTNGGFVGTQTGAITGGTGRFEGAEGEARLEFLHPGELAITLSLR